MWSTVLVRCADLSLPAGAAAVLTRSAARPKSDGEFNPAVVPWQEVIKTRIYFVAQEQRGLLLKHYIEKSWLDEVLVARRFNATGMRWSEFEKLGPHMAK